MLAEPRQRRATRLAALVGAAVVASMWIGLAGHSRSVASEEGQTRADPDLPQWHWARIPAPEGLRHWSMLHGSEQLMVVLADASVQRWTGSSWEEVAPATPSGPTGMRGGAVGPGGEIWIAGDHWAQRFDGSWGPREPVSELVVHGITVDAQGTAWANTLNAGLYRRTPEGWSRVSNLGLHSSPETALWRAVPDDRGGVWIRGEGDLVLHADPSGGRRLPRPEGQDGQPLALTREWGPDGPRLLAYGAAGIWRLTSEDTWTRVAAAGVSLPAWWVGTSAGATPPGRVVEAVDLPRFPSSQVARTRQTRGGRVFGHGWDEAAELFELRPGASVALIEATDTWGLGSLGEVHPPGVADLDGDGREDLLVTREQGRVHALRQGDRAFTDVTTELGLELTRDEITGSRALCDLDGNGLPDLLSHAGLPDDRRQARFVYLRNLGRWIEDVTDRGGFVPPAGEQERTGGSVTCVDVDGDGDLDVLKGRGIQDRGRPGGVVLYLNRGHGRLDPAPLAARGLGAANRWVSHVLAEDLDHDGLVDFLLMAHWSGGYQLLRQRQDGRLEDRTEGTGFGGLYGTPRAAWLARLDDDEWLDLLVVGSYEGVRAWRGGPDLSFRDVTDDWGLRHLAAERALNPPGSAALVDLDADGDLDLVDCMPETGCRLALGSPSGRFEEATRSLLVDTVGVVAVVDVDLGADGDRDLLFVREGDDLVLENRAVELGLVAAPPIRPASRPIGLARRLSWLRRSSDLPLLGGVLLVWLISLLVVRRGGSRLLLGRAGAGVALTLAAGVAFVLFLDAPPAGRGLAAALLALGAPLVGWSEVRWDRHQKARTVAGYRLEVELGRGGMGTVYRAREVATGKRVALKLVNPEILARDEDRALFRSEAEIGSRIDDPRIVRLLGWGEWTVLEAGRPRPTAYLVMELLDGVPLSEVLHLRGALPIAPACAITREIARALVEVHGVGIVHRDIKPGNVMLLSGGEIKLMDFGAARNLAATTSTGDAVLGTIPYAPPEQARGDAPDLRSDLYSLGVLLYELLAGARPFEATQMLPLLYAILNEPPPSLAEARPELPSALVAIVERAMAKEPDDRFQSAGGFAEALAPFAHGSLEPSSGRGRLARSGPQPLSVAPGLGLVGGLGARQPVTYGSTRLGLLYSLVRYWVRYVRAGGVPETARFAESLIRSEVRQSSEPRGRYELARRLQEMAAELGDEDDTAWVGEPEADDETAWIGPAEGR
jgi:hypothetical protein